MISRRQARRDGRRLWRLCLSDGVLDETRARFVVERASRSGRRSAAAALPHFLRLVKADRARHAATVESAAPLDDTTRAAIDAAMAYHYGSATTCTFLVDPALIAGVRVTIGSDVYDGTIRGALSELDARF